jgi:hypothetical protein
MLDTVRPICVGPFCSITLGVLGLMIFIMVVIDAEFVTDFLQ